MSDITLTKGIPETVLDSVEPALQDRLDAAIEQDNPREALGSVIADAPTYLDAWAELAKLGRDPIETYAAYRVGYHRGLDLLRKSGWRGSGFVKWEHKANRGFLRCLAGLQRAAEGIGEMDEADRCREFLNQLDPNLDLSAI